MQTVQSRRTAMPAQSKDHMARALYGRVWKARGLCRRVEQRGFTMYVEVAMLRPCFGRAALCVLWEKRHVCPDVEERRFSAALRDTV